MLHNIDDYITFAEAIDNSVAMSLDDEFWHIIVSYPDPDNDEDVVIIGAKADIPRGSGDVVATTEEFRLTDLLDSNQEVMFHPIDYEKTLVYNRGKSH